MKTKAMNYGAILGALLLILVFSAKAYACACCSEPGRWYQKTGTVDDFHRAEIDNVKFQPVANTYMTEAGEDGIQGMSSVADKYTLSLSKQGRRWTFSFKDEQGRTGTLSFMIPTMMVVYSVDPHGGDGENTGTGPAIYHEWRFTAPVTGTGIFKKGMIGRPRIQLVLQGTSNACIDSAGFHNWNMQIEGPRADYSFYGSFKEAATTSPAEGQNGRTDSHAETEQAVTNVMLSLVEEWNKIYTRELTGAII